MHAQLQSNQIQWPGMKQDIANIVRTCHGCQMTKTYRQSNKLPLTITDTASEPFEKISMDFVGPLPVTENSTQHVPTIQDDLMKYSLAFPTPTTETAIVAFKLFHIFSLFGIPRHIRTDQGIAFCSNLVTLITTELKINKIDCSPYHPESNGALERTHSSLKETLRFQIKDNRNDWDQHIDKSVSAIHSATGYSPYELLFGRKPYLPQLVEDKTFEQLTTETKAKLVELHETARETQIRNKKPVKKHQKRYSSSLDKSLFNSVVNSQELGIHERRILSISTIT